MKLLKTVISTALALASFAANADNFNFSYTFGDSQTVTGSLTGTLIGSFIDSISNVQVSLNNTPFSTDSSGSLYALAWNPATLIYTSAPAVVSTNASQNNFIFQDVNDPSGNGVSNYFSITNDSTFGSVAFAVNTSPNNSGFALDGTSYGAPAVSAAKWTITDVTAPVPEPESYAMLLAGLGLISVVARRRSQG